MEFNEYMTDEEWAYLQYNEELEQYGEYMDSLEAANAAEHEQEDVVAKHAESSDEEAYDSFDIHDAPTSLMSPVAPSSEDFPPLLVSSRSNTRPRLQIPVTLAGYFAKKKKKKPLQAVKFREMHDSVEQCDDSSTSAAQGTSNPQLHGSQGKVFEKISKLKPKLVDGTDFIFLIDKSASMRKRDVSSPQERRIDAVLRQCREFVQAQLMHRERFDRFSLIFFAKDAQLLFSRVLAEQAMSELDEVKVEPAGPTSYRAGLELIGKQFACGKLQALFLSDGCPGDWNSDTCSWFQDEWLKQFRPGSLNIHCIGAGSDEARFTVLQQISQLAGGVTHTVTFDAASLRSTFCAISKYITSSSSGTTLTSGTACHPCHIFSKSPLSRRRIKFAPPPSPAKQFISKETRASVRLQCIRQDYLWDPALQDIRLVSEREMSVIRAILPYAKGCMRFVYEMVEAGSHEGMVAKESTLQQTTRDAELCFVRSTCLARHYAGLFRQRCDVGLEFLPCQLYSVKSADDAASTPAFWETDHHLPYFCGEAFMSGVFTKWLSNNGFISVQDGELPECFAHFTIQASQGLHMVADIQGVLTNRGLPAQNYRFTDPQVLSLDQSFGRADLGQTGIQKFLSHHHCGNMCKAFGFAPAVPSLSAFTPAMRDISRDTATGERSQLIDIFSSGKSVCFVGECSLSFCLAAAKLSGLLVSDGNAESPHRDFNWWACDIAWPQDGPAKDEFNQNRSILEAAGVKVEMESIDAAKMPSHFAGLKAFDTFVWAMPYPDQFSRSTLPSHAVKEQVRTLVHGFVRSAASYMATGGRVSVVLVAKQHLTWGLRDPVPTSVGVMKPQVQLFNLQELLDQGYQPRFGDHRDRSRSANYHTSSEAVLVSWMLLPNKGISDTKLQRRHEHPPAPKSQQRQIVCCAGPPGGQTGLSGNMLTPKAARTHPAGQAPRMGKEHGQAVEIFLLRYSRCPKVFHDIFDTSPELESVRAELSQVGLTMRLCDGAKVCVNPANYSTVLKALQARRLRPHHVVVEKEWLPLVEQCVNRLPKRQKVDLLQAELLVLAASGEDQALTVKRTFLDTVTLFRNPNSVTQSTAEAHGCFNPRRVITDLPSAGSPSSNSSAA